MNFKQATVQTRRPAVKSPEMPAGILQRKWCTCEGSQGPDEERGSGVQRAAIGPNPVVGAPPIIQEVLRSSGQPLDMSVRAFMEPHFRHDFSQVRVHRDTRSAESARAVNALAYTVGRDVVFGEGQYAPATSAGQRLLAHELSHVVQQARAQANSRPVGVGVADDASEQEAELASRSVSANAPFPLHHFPAASTVQRQVFGREDDPIHAPLVESYRKEHGYPLSGKDELGNPIGPSDAEIKYGGSQVGKSDKPSIPAEEEDPGIATADKTLATYAVDKQGKIHGMNIDTASKLVVQALKSSPRAYIMVQGSYPREDTEFDPSQPGDTARSALVQWIGKASIPDIEQRIQSDYGESGPLPPTSGGSIQIQVRYKPIILSNPLTPAGTKGTKEEKGLETEASVVIDPKKGTVETQVELSWQPGSGPAKEVKLTVHVGAQGFSQLEADLAVLKKEIKGPFAGGTISKITITGGFNLSADFDRDTKNRLMAQFSTAVKGALELELAVPKVSKKPTVEISASVDNQGKPTWQIQITPLTW